MAVIGNKKIKEFIWEIVGDKADKTRTVMVKTVKVHPLYNKRFVVRKKYYAHDEKNASKVGDKVRIREMKPKSKLKKWNLIEVM